ncbi:hypothetical protein BpHYR1_046523 [Brachionus plicatilis]|uniref:Uncharacterized protein n=1 Tax=Brachionus plicatilis TaxID=10195 RepID=A0A3M7QTG6_BRAPC|nr:hypothetical protein BpHYR1_046523 [Brachionus plicatilis]
MGPINQELFSVPTFSNQTDIPITTETQTIQSESNNLFVLQAEDLALGGKNYKKTWKKCVYLKNCNLKIKDKNYISMRIN